MALVLRGNYCPASTAFKVCMLTYATATRRFNMLFSLSRAFNRCAFARLVPPYFEPYLEEYPERTLLPYPRPQIAVHSSHSRLRDLTVGAPL